MLVDDEVARRSALLAIMRRRGGVDCCFVARAVRTGTSSLDEERLSTLRNIFAFGPQEVSETHSATIAAFLTNAPTSTTNTAPLSAGSRKVFSVWLRILGCPGRSMSVNVEEKSVTRAVEGVRDVCVFGRSLRAS